MQQFDRWCIYYDLDNKVGFIDLWGVGVPQAAAPFRIGPLPAEEFNACCCVLSAARAAGGNVGWDSTNKAIYF